MKRFGLLTAVLLIGSLMLLGCSKENVYVLEQGKVFEVGTDIPEGTYKVEASDTSDEKEEDEGYTTIIGDEDNPDAIFMSTSDSKEETVELKKGKIINAVESIKLTLIN